MCAGFFVFQPDRLSIYTGFFVALNYLWAGPQFSVSRNHGGVYPPGYGPAFTVMVYLFSSVQSLPGSRSSMITVPSRQPTRLNVASTLIW